MADVWNFLILVMKSVVNSFKSIPVYQSGTTTVYLWEFMVALLILTILTTAVVARVTFAPGDAYASGVRQGRADKVKSSKGKGVKK